MLNASPSDYVIGFSAGAAALVYVAKTLHEMRNRKSGGRTLGEELEPYLEVQTRVLQSIEKSLATLTDIASRTCSTQILHTDGKTHERHAE